MRKRAKTYILVGALCMAAVAATVLMLSFRRNNTNQTSKITSNTTPAKSAVQPTSKNAKVQIQLPRATAIDALVEDYTAPTSLWVVVSKEFPLADPYYRPSDLAVTSLPVRSDKSDDEKSVRTVITPDLTSLFNDAKTAGHDIMIASGFRSYELQQTYFSSYSRSYGEDAASKFSARPGQSEHQTGLAVDIAYVSRECYLDTCFGQKSAGEWLAANAYKYGFVLRYPADKTEVTKYQYEPWHFRYVGKPLATALHESGLTLDEARPYLQTALTELKAQHKL